jgi:hypothetical protein
MGCPGVGIRIERAVADPSKLIHAGDGGEMRSRIHLLEIVLQIVRRMASALATGFAGIGHARIGNAPIGNAP